MARRTFLTVILLLVGIVGSCARETDRVLTEAERIELKMLQGQLADPERSGKTKLEAAELLLTRDYADATEALKGFLVDASNPPGQIAVAKAIANQGGGSNTFVSPLMKMLTGEEPAVRAPAARALVTFKDEGLRRWLVGIALDVRRDRSVRLVVIEALQRVVDKKAVDALVRLLGDREEPVRGAAASALEKLTNIRHFGNNRAKWNRWWRENKNKDRSEWLGELAERLARSNAALEVENARLQERLARAMSDLYAATATGQRDALLLSFLKDPLAEVRLVGVTLSRERIEALKQLPEEIRLQVRAMLSDRDPLVRLGVAMLTAALGDTDTTPVLLEGLEREEVASVREGLLKALGQLRDGRALPAVVGKIRDAEYETVAASAASALVRIAEKHPLDSKQRDEAVEALLERYARVDDAGDVAALREALLTAMGVVGDRAFVPALQGALKDPAATVRLAAVNALGRVGDESLSAQLAPLVAGDPDRGVRQASIAALGRLGGKEHLQTILQRTDPAVEKDPGVRQQAWDVSMGILDKADAETLAAVSKDLVKREDAKAYRIKVMQLLVKALRASQSPELPAVLDELGGCLLESQRPGEAAGVLGEAYAILLETEKPQAMTVWRNWVEALLAGGDPTVVKVISEQNSVDAFAQALQRLEEHLARMSQENKWSTVTVLADAVVKELAPRLTAARREAFEKIAAEARGRLTEADRQRVGQLVRGLQSADKPTRDAAAVELQGMGQRALTPLLEELKKLLQGENTNPDTEQAILAVLRKIAPKLTGYDHSAPKPDRIKLVESWLTGATGD